MVNLRERGIHVRLPSVFPILTLQRSTPSKMAEKNISLLNLNF